jgi:cytochrome c556
MMMFLTEPACSRMRLALAIAAAALPALVSAQSAPERAIRARQASYYLMGHQMARINATVKGDLPFDQPSLQMSAELLDLVGRTVGENFPAGSDQGTTKAKADIWKETPRFRQLAQASQAEVLKLKAAVQGGELAAIKAAYGATSKSCKACHDVFKDQ